MCEVKNTQITNVWEFSETFVFTLYYLNWNISSADIVVATMDLCVSFQRYRVSFPFKLNVGVGEGDHGAATNERQPAL